MKLLKKLLPIVTVASTAAVVAPMVTACSASIKKDYKPTVKQHDAQTFDTKDEAVKEYLTQASNNKQIIIQDIYWTLSKALATMPESVNPKISANIGDIQINVTDKLISLKYVVTIEGNGEVDGKKTESKLKLDYKLTNIPLDGIYTTLLSEDTKWGFWVVGDREKWTDSTKVEGSVYQKATIDGKPTVDPVDTGKYTITKSTLIRPQDTNMSLVLSWAQNIAWNSYYFLNCKVK